MRNIIYVLTCLSILSCGDQSDKLPDVSQVDAEATIIRYDQKLSALDTNNIVKSYNELIGQYPYMTDLYFKQLIKLYDPDNQVFYGRITEFIKDDRIQKLIADVNAAYPNLGDVKAELTQGLKYYKHYFPRASIPRFYTLFSEFGYQSFIFSDGDRDAVGIGLDMYLDDFDYKTVDPSNPAFSDYLAKTYNKAYIAKKSLEILVNDRVGESSGKRFVDQMIHKGKVLYILEKLMPTTSKVVLHEYTSEQMAWVTDNELEIWTYFLNQELIYETNHLKITKYLEKAPTSKGMPAASPGRTGEFIGYKIVTAYMKKFPNTTVEDLVAITDSQKLFKLSKYKPPRK